MKTFKRTCLYLLGFIALLLTFTFIINLPAFDEELLPEVAAIKNIKAQKYENNNAYPAFIAINAASGPDLAEVATKVRSHLNQKIQDSGVDYLNDEELNQLIGTAHDVSWQNSYDSCNSRRDTACMATLFDELKNKPISDPRLIDQLNRYHDLIGITDYQGSTQVDISAPMLVFSATLSLKRLYMADAFVNHDSDVFLQRGERDAKFWRMVLRKSHLLITKMVAVSSYRGDLASFSAAIKKGQLSPLQLKRLQNQIKPLNAAEMDFSKTFEFELKYAIQMFDEADMDGGLGTSQWINLFQLNATHNTNYKYSTKPLLNLNALDAADFYQYISDGKLEQIEKPFNWSPTDLYNPTGKILAGFAIPAYTDYIGRIHDLNGMISLLNLQTELALSPGVPVLQVINDSQWSNPYTGEPMSYDEKSHRIFFDCLEQTSSCQLDL